MAKVKINKLPPGYKMANGRVVKTMALGGVPRDTANLEAEKGETVLTDLDNDGAHELYNIGGKRHSEGGTPLNLPPQSFIFSDTAKMKFSSDELGQLGIESKKKQTPAWASKRFKLNQFIKSMDNEHSDNISDETSELMIHKNKLQLSKIAFMSEAKKDFLDEEGNINVPLAAYPFLISKGIEPKEFIAKLEEINAAKEQAQQAPLQNGNNPEQPAPGLQDFTGSPQGPPQEGPMHQMPDGSMMPGEAHGAQPQGPQGPQGAPQGGGIQEIIAKVLEALTQGIQPEEIMQGLVQMGIPEEQAVQLLQKVMQDTQGAQGPPQGMSAQGPPQGPPQMGPPQGGGMPPQGMMPPQGPPQGGMPPEMMQQMMAQQGPPQGGMPPEMMANGGSLRRFQGEKGSSEIDGMLGNVTQGEIENLDQNRMTNNVDWRNLEDQPYVNHFDRGLPLGRTSQGQFVDSINEAPFSVNPRTLLGNVGTRVGNIFRKKENDIDPTRYIRENSGEKTNMNLNTAEYADNIPFSVEPRTMFGNVGTRMGNIFRSKENDIDPTRYIRENSGEKTNMLLSEFVHGGALNKNGYTKPCYECGGGVPKLNNGGNVDAEGNMVTASIYDIPNKDGAYADQSWLTQANHGFSEGVYNNSQRMNNLQAPGFGLLGKAVKTDKIIDYGIQAYDGIKNWMSGDSEDVKQIAGQPEGVVPMNVTRYGGDPFVNNPLNSFVYGGALPKAQNSNETLADEHGCVPPLSWNGTACVNINGATNDDEPGGVPHDHDGDGIADHEAANHVGESHGAAGDVAYQCQDVDANGNCISFAEANKTHTDFQDVMKSGDFQYARDVWWDIYEDGRKNQSGYETNTDGSFKLKDGKKIPQSFNGALEFDREEGMNNYFLYNQILHDLNEHDLDPGDKGDDFFTHAKSLGYFQNGETPEQVKDMGKQFQGLYRALNIAKRTDATSDLFTNIETLPEGDAWDDGSHRDQWGNAVSTIDGKIGKTTKKQFSSAVNPMIPDKQKPPCPGKPLDFDVEAAQIECEKRNALNTNADGNTEGGVTDAYMWNANNCRCEKAPGDFIPPDKVPMIPWVQDQNSLTGAIMNKGLREDFYPMMTNNNFTPADMLRDDPLSRIHANNSLAQTAIDSGADPYKIFANAADGNRKAVADVQSRDVQEYNALARANMTGKAAIDQSNMQANKDYVDDVNAVGTNRINTNIADNENILTQQNNLITNAQNTQMMNQLRPNYNVDPQATPGNGRDAINFRNAKAYNDETGGGGNNNVSAMSYQDAYAHAAGAPPEGLGMKPAEANNWAKNYIQANKSTNTNSNGYNTPNGRMDGTAARYGGEGTRRNGAALRQWMRGIK